MLIQLATFGLIAALLPLSIVWVSENTDKYRKLIEFTLLLCFSLIMFGSYLRLNESNSITPTIAWFQISHRYLAMTIGVLILSISMIAWRKWLQQRESRFSPFLPMLMLGLLCLQGAIGALTMTLKQPLIVTSQLLLGMSLLALLTWQGARLNDHRSVSRASMLQLPALLSGILLTLQLALGGWVSSNYAALACTDFPLCQGMLWPPMDLPHGFALWHDRGTTSSGESLSLQALTAIHWVHRGIAFAVLALTSWVAIQALAFDGLRRTSFWLLSGLILQFSTGILMVLLNFPLTLALIHTGGAALLVILLTTLNFKIRRAG